MRSRMTHHQPDLSQLNHSLIWDGFRQLIPVSLFVAIFGAAFGLAASHKGVDPTSVTMMSLLVSADAVAAKANEDSASTAVRQRRLLNVVIAFPLNGCRQSDYPVGFYTNPKGCHTRAAGMGTM